MLDDYILSLKCSAFVPLNHSNHAPTFIFHFPWKWKVRVFPPRQRGRKETEPSDPPETDVEKR
jgi:hypothetical protein